MLLSQLGKPGLREAATDSVQGEVATTPSRKSTAWHAQTRQRSGSSMPISVARLTTFHTPICSKPLVQFLGRNSSNNGSKQDTSNMERFMQRSKERRRVEWRHRCSQTSLSTEWKKPSGSSMTTGANSSENGQW